MTLDSNCLSDLLLLISNRLAELDVKDSDKTFDELDARLKGFSDICEPEICLEKLMISFVPKIERGDKTSINNDELYLLSVLAKHSGRTTVKLRYLDCLNFVYEVANRKMPGFDQFLIFYAYALRRFLNAKT